MKITKDYLKKIITEEIDGIGDIGDMDPDQYPDAEGSEDYEPYPLKTESPYDVVKREVDGKGSVAYTLSFRVIVSAPDNRLSGLPSGVDAEDVKAAIHLDKQDRQATR